MSSGFHSFLLEVLDLIHGSSKSSSPVGDFGLGGLFSLGWSHLGTFCLGSKIHNLLYPAFGIGEDMEIGDRTKSSLYLAHGDFCSTLDSFG